MTIADSILVYAEVVKTALPFAVAFILGNTVVCTFLRMAFGGKVTFE